MAQTSERVSMKEWKWLSVTASWLLINPIGKTHLCIASWKLEVFVYKSTKEKIQFTRKIATVVNNSVHWYHSLRDPLRISLSRREYKSFKRLAIRSRVRISCKIWSMDWSELSDLARCWCGMGNVVIVAWGGGNWRHLRCWWEVGWVASRGALLHWGVTGSVESSESRTFLAQKTIP